MPPEEIALDPLLESMDPDTSEPPALPEKTPKKKSRVTANNNTDDTPEPKPIKKKNPNWSIEEDKQLCVAWLNTSQDSVIGVGQKGSTFWERIYHFYTNLVDELNKENKTNKKFKPLPIRLENAIECRWGHIMKTCNKFGGCYSQVKGRMKSGRSHDDIVSIPAFPLIHYRQADKLLIPFFHSSLRRPKSCTALHTIMLSILIIAGGS
jgi:hypothetical protein